MSKFQKIFIFFTFIVVFGTAYAMVQVQPSTPNPQYSAQDDSESEDTPPDFRVNDPKTDTYDDLNKNYSMDLENPSNLTQSVEYDPVTNIYYFTTKVGDQEISTPFTMTEKEYLDYSMKQSMNNYWVDKNKEAAEQEKENKVSLTDIKIGLGAADRIFGPGGVQVKMQGSAELLFGFKFNKVQNPTLSERLRNPPPIFDFDEKIQLNVNGKVGDKLTFNMNYNTEASLDYDQSKIKLAYEGKEDDIIQSIEAGNVSLPLNSSLIRGSSALFGIKTKLKFGRLTVDAVASQQETETKTVSLKNGSQTTKFEVEATDYDENRHFFLAHYFRDNFEKSMSRLPNINSGVVINRVEVWVTNKKADYTQARNIVAFLDLGEINPNLNNTVWNPLTSLKYPFNKANDLYGNVTLVDGIRDIQKVNSVMTSYNSSVVGGEDFEKVESARRLEESEYTLNKDLGFISLRSQLNSDEVLAVAYEYTVGGKVYQVGEFSSDGIESPDCLMLKLLKGTAMSPDLSNWDLMMKNVYALGGAQVQEDDFKLDVVFRNDSSGVYVNYLSDGAIKNQALIKVLKLDRLNTRDQLRPDGNFDFIDGYTILPQSGRVIFPVLEPFGSDLREAIGNDALADQYVFEELYTKTKTQAEEETEKNKFRLKGEYKASVNSEIRLNAMNVPQGSVTVTAGGLTLNENVDYTVDYSMGVVTIINQAILESGSTIDVSLESQSLFSMQRKTLSGVHLEYQFNKDFSLGGTMMHLSEKPLTNKVTVGDEPMSNTIWGLNTSYKQETQLVTDLLDKLPIVQAKAPSSLLVNAEFAQLIPGHPDVVGASGIAYIDDFEASKTSINIQYPYAWFLASTPKCAKFTEASLSNNIEYGKNRALLAWYTIDNLFTTNSSTTPSHIKKDKDQLSNHFVRKVEEQEVFPNREPIQGQTNTLSILNLSYYPKERGPYNLDVDNINSDGSLSNPEDRWGGIMRKMDVTDFETANIEYVEFWMMDPFVYDSQAKGGDLYINLGDISEDILKDGNKSFENGLPVDGDTTKTDTTEWGRVPTIQSVVNAFDNSESARQYQDVGLDGLRTEDELTFHTYRNYLDKYLAKIDPMYLDSLNSNLFSPINDPAGDNYRYFRGSDEDEAEMSILDRYKYYNGIEGNSPVTTSTSASYSTSATNLPNIEDINQDNNLNEYEKYFQYKVSIRPKDFVVGQNYITDKVDATVSLENGNVETVSWYQFKVPIKEYDSIVGNRSASDYSSIRFMRMYMTDFTETTHLRFGTLELVRGDWRKYKQALYDITRPPSSEGVLDLSVVNIEENADKKPVNYVLPPGVDREQDPSQSQIRQENEQALVVKVTDLAPADARGVYKSVSYDMRQFKKFQMFVHAEKFIDDVTALNNSELTVFVRIGSDLTENYYEYEIPLQLTAPGIYSQSTSDGREAVWPEENMFNFILSNLSEIKSERNKKLRKGDNGVSLSTRFQSLDPSNDANKIYVIGNPTLADVQSMMIGVRNQSSNIKSGEIWVNEMRLTGFNEDGGYAAVVNTTLNLSDIGSVNVGGRIETVGFGGIEDNVLERRMDDYTQFNVSTNLELGRFVPEKTKLRMPMFYSYSKDVSKPKYDAYNTDILLETSLEEAGTQEEKDSILDYSTTVYTTKSFNLTNVKLDLKSKTPMFYDPTNFSVSYAYSESNLHDPDVERELTQDYKGSINYQYNLSSKPWEPFKKVAVLKSPNYRIIGDFNVYYLPASIGYSTSLSRHYEEKQLRNYNNMEILYSDPENALLTNSKDFLWNRRFDLKYDFSKALKFTYSSVTNAQIEETKYSPVNKELFPDEYENWKDTVLRSIGDGGTPYAFQQVVTGSYTIPINKIPAFNWITSNALYTGNYTWDRGALTEEDEAEGRTTSSLGNSITSLGTWQFNGRFNLEQLYNKSTYLSEVNRKYSSKNNSRKKKESNAPEKYDQKLNLVKGRKQRVIHRLDAPKVNVVATDEKNNPVDIKYNIINNNALELIPEDNYKGLQVVITAADDEGDSMWKKMLEVSSRGLMMFRNVSFNYNQSDGMSVGGFMPQNGLLGQDDWNGTSAPGYLFALGYQDPGFIQNAINNSWLSMDSTISAISKTYTSDLKIKMLVEPLNGLKIDLGVSRNYATQSEVQYMYDGMPTTQTGSFSMSTIAVGTLFSGVGTSKNNYRSTPYETFKANRAKVLAQLNAKYSSVIYPSGGFMSESDASVLVGTVFNESNGAFSQNSSEVLIPSFLSAYTGVSLDADNFELIPTIWRMLPNWRITYDGLSRLPYVSDYFKSVNLTHVYNCKYNIGGYSTYADWVGVDGDFGFVSDVSTGLPVPSSQFEVPAVSIVESFSPLLRIDMTMNNNITISSGYNIGRTLNLNIASTQLVESSNNEYTFGFGYRISDFDVILKLNNDKESKVKNDLNLRLDMSISDTKALIRKLDDDDATQATSGDHTFGIQTSAEYVFSSKLNFRLYYDRQVSTPLISSSYPTSNSNFGMSVKLLLTR